MTVKELISELQDYDPETIVCGHSEMENAEYEINSIEYFDHAFYFDKNDDSKRGKIIVI